MKSIKKNRDHLIPWYFVAFFLCIALVDGVMVTLAVRTQSGLVTDHPYEKGLAYNNVVQAASQQEQLGWKGTIGFHNTAVKEGTIAFTVKDAAGKTLTMEKITAVISRPSAMGSDFTVALHEGDNAISFPLEGVWEIRIYATQGDNNYQQSKRIMVQ